MRRAALLAVFAAASACGEAPPRAPVAGPEARKAVDAATQAYAACIEDRALAAPAGGVPGTIVGGAVRDCRPARDALGEKIMAFHELGHPNYTPDQLRAVAEASIQTIEPELRSAGVAAYITRTSPNAKAE